MKTQIINLREKVKTRLQTNNYTNRFIFKVLALGLILFLVVLASNFSKIFVSKISSIPLAKGVSGVYKYDTLEKKEFLPSNFALSKKLADTTVFIYASGNNFNDSLIKNSINLAERYSSTSGVEVLVLFDRKVKLSANEAIETNLYHINSDLTEGIDSTLIESLGKADISNPAVLYDFLHFGQINFPSKKRVLILDGIGKGPSGLIWDESANTYLSTANLKTAISQPVYGFGGILDLIVLNSSFGGNIETLSTLTEFAKFVIASPESLELKSLNYFKIIEAINQSLNLNSEAMAKNVFNTLHSRDCINGYNFKLYNIEKVLDISNALESISSGYFKDTSGKFKMEILRSIASLDARMNVADSIPLFDLNKFAFALGQSTDEKLKLASEGLILDIANSIVNSCESSPDQNLMAFSFPFNTDTRLENHFLNSSYDRIPSFRELIRSIYSNDSSNFEINIKPLIRENSVLYPIHPAQSGCIAGFTMEEKLVILKENLGYLDAENFICSKLVITNFPKSIYGVSSSTFSPFLKASDTNFYSKKVEVKVSGENLVGELYLNEVAKEKSFLEVYGTFLQTLSFRIPNIDGMEVLPFWEFLDKDGIYGVSYENKFKVDLENTSRDLISISEKIAYIPVFIESTRLGAKAYLDESYPQSIKAAFTFSYKVFTDRYALKGFSPLTSLVTEENISSKIKTSKYDFSNVALFFPNLNINKFRFYEMFKSESFSFSGGKLELVNFDLGEDKLYYEGDILPSSANTKFWDNWFKTL